jgi:hypothetical protein
MPREFRSHLPHLKDKVYQVPTAAEKRAANEVERLALEAANARFAARPAGAPPPVSRPADEAKPRPAVATPLVTPIFDPERLAVQSYSAEGGMGFIQGKNFFNASGRFVRELPESAWYVTTPEMEENNRRARARQRQVFGRKVGESHNAPALPLKLLNAARENARASAAESLAE